MSLYLKYRPQIVDDLDLTEVRGALKKILSSKNIPHAFLFSGPKGTGKTSAARIVAKAVNCENPKKGVSCNKCYQCTSIAKGDNIDVIEIDAASHRGIDDIRSLKDSIKLSPVQAKKKVYIIDEAHMLTVEASNALLKTLEEPPEHVIFILATTNPEKLIETINSRVTTVRFSKAKDEEIAGSLKKVAKGEGVKLDDVVLKKIVQYANGSFRDAHKHFEQLLAQGIELSSENVEKVLGGGSMGGLDLAMMILEGQVKDVVNQIEKLCDSGVGAYEIGKNMLATLHEILIQKINDPDRNKDIETGSIILLIEKLREAMIFINTSPIEQLPLEAAIINWASGENIVSYKNADKSEPLGKKKGSIKSVDGLIEDSESLLDKSVESLEVDDNFWTKLLLVIKEKNRSVEALLKASRLLGFEDGKLVIGVYYRFHKERLEEFHNQKIIEDAMIQVLGEKALVRCKLVDPPTVVDKGLKNETIPNGTVLNEPPAEDSDLIDIATDIFSS